MKSIIDVLKDARELLSDPAKWTKGEMARNADGNRVWSLAPEATCFCMLGAIERAAQRWEVDIEGPTYLPSLASRELRRTVISRTGAGTASWNDHPETTHEQVLVMFDAAISRLEGAAA